MLSQAPPILVPIQVAKVLLVRVKAIESLITYRTPIQVHYNMAQMLFTTPSYREGKTIDLKVLEQLEGNLQRVDVFFLVILKTEIINTVTSILLNLIRFKVYQQLHIAPFPLHKS